MMAAAFPPVFAGSKFAVMGLGGNGLAAAHALQTMGAKVIAWDDKEEARAKAAAEDIPLADLSRASLDVEALVLSPGIPHLFPAPHPVAARVRAAGLPIVSDAELLFRAVRRAGSRARFVGVTGTNGKSTTVALLAHILEAGGLAVAAGGNIEPAALALPLLPDAGCYVLEMSSYMLERIAELRFSIAVLLNISPDHLDRHGGMAGYVAAKQRIFESRVPDALGVIGIDDEPSRQMAERLAPPLVRISGKVMTDFWAGEGILRERAEPISVLSEARALPGWHNGQNAAAAAAAAAALGLSRETIAAAMRSFVGLPHRLERICTVDGVTFIDDSKATNADSVASALACYPKVVWIAGGMGKAGGIESLAPLFPRVAQAFLIGRDASLFAATLAQNNVPHRVLGTLEAAVPAALEAARGADVPIVLLSPAAASFDQFRNYQHRGDRFAALARSLASAAGRAA